MSVMTIFFLGTSSNSFDFANKDYESGELVSTLARNHSGMEFIDWVLVDGPGSGNYQEDEKWVKPAYYLDTKGKALGSGWEENVKHTIALLKGEYDWKRTDYTYKNLQAFQKIAISNPDTHFGQIARTEWVKDDDGTYRAELVTDQKRRVTQQDLQAQKIKIFRKGRPITAVNLIGWSRGGVTCHMMANAMFKDPKLNRLPVKIFAIDPVPGSMNFQSHRTNIPQNVEHYVAIYAQDERSYGFAATVPTFSSYRTIVQMLPMPGRHGTVVGNASSTGGGGGGSEFSAVGKVVRNLAEFYLTNWGTTFHSNKKLNHSTFQTLKLYEEILGKQVTGAFRRLQSNVYTTSYGGGGDDGRYMGVGSDWTSTEFNKIERLAPDRSFVNWHHRSIFRSIYGPIRSISKIVMRFLFVQYPYTMAALQRSGELS